MNKSRSLEKRILLRISLKDEDVFMRKDFEDFGGYDQIGRVLRQLAAKGKIVRIGYGLYAKMKQSILTGKPIPCKSLPVLAKEALKRLGVEITSSQLKLNYNEGKSTQVPTGRLIGIKGRFNRKIGYDGTYVYYERAT